jgi:hypothetical protein
MGEGDSRIYDPARGRGRFHSSFIDPQSTPNDPNRIINYAFCTVDEPILVINDRNRINYCPQGIVDYKNPFIDDAFWIIYCRLGIVGGVFRCFRGARSTAGGPFPIIHDAPGTVDDGTRGAD